MHTAHGTHANGPKGPTGFSFCLGLFLIIIHLLYPLLLARVSVIRIPLYHTHAAPELFSRRSNFVHHRRRSRGRSAIEHVLSSSSSSSVILDRECMPSCNLSTCT